MRSCLRQRVTMLSQQSNWECACIRTCWLAGSLIDLCRLLRRSYRKSCIIRVSHPTSLAPWTSTQRHSERHRKRHLAWSKSRPKASWRHATNQIALSGSKCADCGKKLQNQLYIQRLSKKREKTCFSLVTRISWKKSRNTQSVIWKTLFEYWIRAQEIQR